MQQQQQSAYSCSPHAPLYPSQQAQYSSQAPYQSTFQNQPPPHAARQSLSQQASPSHYSQAGVGGGGAEQQQQQQPTQQMCQYNVSPQHVQQQQSQPTATQHHPQQQQHVPSLELQLSLPTQVSCGPVSPLVTVQPQSTTPFPLNPPSAFFSPDSFPVPDPSYQQLVASSSTTPVAAAVSGASPRISPHDPLSRSFSQSATTGGAGGAQTPGGGAGNFLHPNIMPIVAAGSGPGDKSSDSSIFCRICRKPLTGDEKCHICTSCTQPVCDDCSSYSCRDETKVSLHD